MDFHEHGFATPSHKFFRGLLHHYKIELQKSKVDVWVIPPIDCANVHVRNNRGELHMDILLKKSHKGWHRSWFYVKNNEHVCLPIFTGQSMAGVPREWSDGPMQKEKDRFVDLLSAIQHLKELGLNGVGVVGVYHVRRVAPLMAWTVALYQMGPDVSFFGSVMSIGMIRDSEIGQRIREAFEAPPGVPGPDHQVVTNMTPFMSFRSTRSLSPVKRPEDGFVGLARFGPFCKSEALLPEDVATRAVNRLTAEARKKRKDDRRWKNIERETARQERARPRRAGEAVPSEDEVVSNDNDDDDGADDVGADAAVGGDMRAALMQEYEDEDKQPPLQTAGASDLVALQSEAGSSSRAVGMTGSRPSVMGVLSAVPSPTLTGESCRVAAAANPQSAVSVLGKRSGPSGSASRGRSFKRPRSASCR
ncbi:uncharacterized protein LOC120652448 [Panicum virgatum]|uniref:uncharacterized protein LOC120652448 n=1 Tax=Panicum virgatum TaxID=38727 RepID=UPI0019D4F7F7|nr:uncharacterized protein LOC120652448 [Panicum virgatum]